MDLGVTPVRLLVRPACILQAGPLGCWLSWGPLWGGVGGVVVFYSPDDLMFFPASPVTCRVPRL